MRLNILVYEVKYTLLSIKIIITQLARYLAWRFGVAFLTWRFSVAFLAWRFGVAWRGILV